MADYCTLDDITSDGRLDIDASTYDSDLLAMITGISRRIDRHYGVVDDAFAQGNDATRYYTGEAIDGTRLVLDMPLISVTSIVNGDDNNSAVTAYRLYPRNGQWYSEIKLLSTAADGWLIGTDGEIEVTGKWGFSATVPDEIREAAAYWAAWLLKRYQAALQDASANFELGQIVYSEGIPKPVISMLPTYRVGVG